MHQPLPVFTLLASFSCTAAQTLVARYGSAFSTQNTTSFIRELNVSMVVPPIPSGPNQSVDVFSVFPLIQADHAVIRPAIEIFQNMSSCRGSPGQWCLSNVAGGQYMKSCGPPNERSCSTEPVSKPFLIGDLVGHANPGDTLKWHGKRFAAPRLPWPMRCHGSSHGCSAELTLWASNSRVQRCEWQLHEQNDPQRPHWSRRAVRCVPSLTIAPRPPLCVRRPAREVVLLTLSQQSNRRQRQARHHRRSRRERLQRPRRPVPLRQHLRRTRGRRSPFWREAESRPDRR